MPIIDLEGRDPQYQLLEISSVMCFPSDKESKARRNWILKQLIGIAATHYDENATTGSQLELSEHIGNWLGNTVYYLGDWGALANATVGKGQKRSAIEEAKQRMVQGLIIGFCFKYALSNDGGISTGAKQFCTDNNDMFFKKRGLKPPIQTHEHIINKLWPRYRDAAHLWAALGENKNMSPQKPHHFIPLDQFDAEVEPKGLIGFLKLGDLYLAKGISHIPKPGPQKPILDTNTVWRIKI